MNILLKLLSLPRIESQKLYLPYGKKDSILTPAESRFYRALLEALENRAVIVPKVGLQDVFDILDREQYRKARNRISTRHIDFLICEIGTLRPLFGIELDDSSHNKPEAQRRDELKNRVFAAAMLPLVRIPVTGTFKVEFIQEKIQPFFEKEEKKEGPSEAPLCPNCKIPMVRKTAQRGEHKGQDFWACPNYPTCKELINISQNSSN
ncbi:MAG TPA: DUF2726 domain-containing protein [Cyclobacteriaceae bacterium]|nr:DUF2726 domain-containing protein [Cyclobacteriaceae bacterium]